MIRALVVSNMLPDEGSPERGRFVRDQVAALRRLGDMEVELFEFPPGPRALAGAAMELGRGHGGGRYDVVHAHFGLSAWPALAVRAPVRGLTVHGTDVLHPRTRLATGAVLPLMDLIGAVSRELALSLPGARARARARVLPSGVDTDRFRPIPRAEARRRLGLDPDRSLLLFAADPARPEKRYDRALAVAGGTALSALGGVDPELVPLWVNAANAVLAPSEREGFGLSVLEALACDVPVLATPVGIHPEVLAGIAGTLCEPFEAGAWRAALQPALRSPDPPRIAGRVRAERFSTARMAELLRDAWRDALARGG